VTLKVLVTGVPVDPADSPKLMVLTRVHVAGTGVSWADALPLCRFESGPDEARSTGPAVVPFNVLEETLPTLCDSLTTVPIDVLDRVPVRPASPSKGPSDSVCHWTGFAGTTGERCSRRRTFPVRSFAFYELSP
jgi:hypothetical protein